MAASNGDHPYRSATSTYYPSAKTLAIDVAMRRARQRRRSGTASARSTTAAVVKTLDKPKTCVSVPGWERRISILASLLPDRGRRWLNKKAGNDTIFLHFDAKARKAYEDRAQHATGVVESD